MALTVQFEDHELAELQLLINRALNCWEPKDVPKWAWQLDARVTAKLNDLKAGIPVVQITVTSGSGQELAQWQRDAAGNLVKPDHWDEARRSAIRSNVAAGNIPDGFIEDDSD